MKKLLLLLSIVAMRQIQGQTWVTIPDANFVTQLQTIVPSAMNGNQMDITNSAVTTHTFINVLNKNISDLTGIQYFTSLTTLWASNNHLTSLPPLPNSLQSLSCSLNQLTSLPTLPPTLTGLNCGTNSLTTLPSLPNTLQSLVCPSNQLSSLPTLPNSLTTLQCNSNLLSSLPTLPSNLGALVCDHNNISCFPYFPATLNDPAAFSIANNPYNCLPNYVSGMDAATLAQPLCGVGNSNGCAVAGIEQMTLSNVTIELRPNPTSDQFFIETNAMDKLTVDLYDVNGRHVLSKNVNDKSIVDVTTLNAGVYSVTIKMGDGIINKKLIITR